MIRSSSSGDPQESRARRFLAQAGEGPPAVEGEDDVARAKRALIELATPPSAEAEQDAAPGLLKRHPYACAAAALAAGIVVGRVPMLRNVLFKAVTWGATAYAQRAVRQLTG